MKNKYLLLALKEAKKAYDKGEVPVGAVVVFHDEVIAKAHNTRHNNEEIFGHAEINALKKAAKKIGSWRLEKCEVYVTLEPCCMCAGALIQARIKKVTYGALDPKGGCCQSIGSILDFKSNHKVDYEYLPTPECGIILKQFFLDLRKR